MAWSGPLSGDTAEQRAAHAKERRRWEPLVRAGRATCQQGLPGNGSSGTCVYGDRRIYRGQRWALGHRDDRDGWIGPVHHRCNLLDAASRGGQAKKARYGNRRGATNPRKRRLEL